MALIDNATLAINSGNYFTAAVGTEPPTDLSTVATAPEWENVGHTSLEDILGMDSEGGEVTILGTLQNSQLRTRRSTRTDTINIILQQFDTASIKLSHGSNAEVLSNGMVTKPKDPTPTQKAFLAVYVDGSNIFALWVPKADILGSENFSVDDTESLAGLPLGITPLVLGTNKYTYALTPLGDVGSVSAWQAETAYVVGDDVTVTGGTLECSSAGTSGTVEPTLPGTVGGTVTDGTVTWTRTA